MFLSFLFLFFMDTWGLVPKSQIDPETIEEAIIRLIGEHETDPIAHTGDNESLEAHRAEGILDHRAGSVLADKWTMTEFSISEDFRTFSHWDTVGDVSNSDWPTLYLAFDYGTTNKSEIYKNIQLPAPYLSTDFDQMFQVTVMFDSSNNNFHSWIGVGLEDELPADGYGFIINNGVLKACVSYSGTRTFSGTLSLDLNAPHIYRAQLNAFTQEIEFYIDGSLVATIDAPATSWDSDLGPRIGVRVVSSNDGIMKIADLFFARSVV